jgi:hypothetical protein
VFLTAPATITFGASAVHLAGVATATTNWDTLVDGHLDYYSLSFCFSEEGSPLFALPNGFSEEQSLDVYGGALVPGGAVPPKPATVALAADWSTPGTFQVGPCVANLGTVPLELVNSAVGGWLLVTR